MAALGGIRGAIRAALSIPGTGRVRFPSRPFLSGGLSHLSQLRCSLVIQTLLKTPERTSGGRGFKYSSWVSPSVEHLDLVPPLPTHFPAHAGRRQLMAQLLRVPATQVGKLHWGSRLLDLAWAQPHLLSTLLSLDPFTIKCK